MTKQIDGQTDKPGSLQKTKPKVNIEIPMLHAQDLKWTKPEDVQTSINELYQYAEASTNASIEWYGMHKNSLAKWSQGLRSLTIILTSLGGLMPIISALGKSTIELPTVNLNVGQLGYLFLGLAAASVGYDKFFGYSSGWMRYITTKMMLEKTLAEFRLDWAMMTAKLGNKPPTPDQVQLMLQRLKEFILTTNNHIEKETQAWISEFKTNIAELEKTTKAQVEASQPGAIEITVTNGMETEDGFTVALDGMEIRKVRGTKYQIGYVPPGPHKIAITGSIKNEPLDASELVNVSPGEIAKATLAFPVKEAQP